VGGTKGQNFSVGARKGRGVTFFSLAKKLTRTLLYYSSYSIVKEGWKTTLTNTGHMGSRVPPQVSQSFNSQRSHRNAKEKKVGRDNSRKGLLQSCRYTRAEKNW